MQELTIPKKIHFCWFGKNEKSELAKKCLSSWKKELSDYEFIEWNEDNFDINSVTYVRKAYEKKKYSFVADYVRIYALYYQGGIYLDLDVEVKKSFNCFLKNQLFFGFEDDNHVSTGIIGAVKKHFFIKELIDYYHEQQEFNLRTNVDLITQKLCFYGLKEKNINQSICNEKITIYSSDYFSPLEFGKVSPKVTNNTITVHWFEGTWQNDKKFRLKLQIVKILKSLLGTRLYYFILRRLKGDIYAPINIAIFSNDIFVQIHNSSLDNYPKYLCLNAHMEILEGQENIISYRNAIDLIIKLFHKRIKFVVVDDQIPIFYIKLFKMINIKLIEARKKRNEDYEFQIKDYTYEK